MKDKSRGKSRSRRTLEAAFWSAALVASLLSVSLQYRATNGRYLLAELPAVEALASFVTEQLGPSNQDLATLLASRGDQRPTYNDLADFVLERVEAQSQPHSLSSYNRATVAFNQTSWFPKRKMCKETCCVETVAVSLEQDRHQIIGSGDGRDLSDLVLEHWFPRGEEHLKYHSSHLQDEMLPCLVPGTILFIENHDKGMKYFWNTLRPKIHVPYTLIVAGSDMDSPGISDVYFGDPLLQKFYGTNPRNPQTEVGIRNLHKYQVIGVGFSRVHPQEKHILPYLELTNFTNPFLNKEKWDLNKRPLDFDQDIFVHFGLNRKGRKRMWNILCPVNSTTGSSCNGETKELPAHEIYTDMSQYRFGISPKGKGFDCYRTWEMLTLGLIPVIDERPLGGRKLFEGLPVVHMRGMETANTKQDFMNAIQEYIQSDAFQNATFDKAWERLFLHYRRRQILQDTQREKEILVDENGKEYYQAYHYSVRGPNITERPTFCHVEGSCETPGDTVRAHWLKNPTPPLSKRDEAWLTAWKNGD